MRRKEGSEMMIKWTGPHQVSGVPSGYLYELEELITGARDIAHASQVRAFGNVEVEIDEEITDYEKFQRGEYCVIDKFLDICEVHGNQQMLVW